MNTTGFWSGFPRGIFFTNSVCLKPRHLLWFKTFKAVLEGVGPNSSAGVLLVSVCIPGFPPLSRQERFICADRDNVWTLKLPYLRRSLNLGHKASGSPCMYRNQASGWK